MSGYLSHDGVHLFEQTRAIILRTEVRRALEAAAFLEAVLGAQSIKPALLRTDEATLHYHRSLVSSLREEVTGLEHYLQMM